LLIITKLTINFFNR